MADSNGEDPREGAGSDVSRRRQLISGANAATVIAATIAIAFLANAIVSQFSRLRIDMTQNNRFTLSEASKNVAADFDNLEVKAFISANMPPPMHTMERRLRDMLTEYKAASGGDITIDIYTPGSKELSDKRQKEIERDAKSYGCEKVGLRSGGRNKVSVRTVYKCVAFIKDGRQQEVIKNLSSGGRPGQMNFEYEFTKALMNLQGREARKVAFVKGFGGLADRRGFTRKIGQRFQKLFDGLIESTSVDLSKKDASIPEDVSALILLNPSKKVSKTAKYKIDQFLQQGGSVGWYQSATGVDQKMKRRMRMQGGAPRKPLNPNLQEFFADYGLKHRKDTVIDRQNGMVAVVPYKGKRALARHPAGFTTSNISHSVPFIKNFGTLGFPAPSSIQVQSTAKDNEELDVYKLVRTEDTAVRIPRAVTDLSLEKLKAESEDEKKGPFTLVAALQGNIPSYFDDKKPPKGVKSKKKKGKSQKAASGRVLVVGSGGLLQPQSSIGYNRQLAGLGQRFFFASLEWLAQDSALAQIRGKSLPQLINDVDTSTRRWIQFINIAGVPVFFALLGILMMLRRSYRRNRIRALDWS